MTETDIHAWEKNGDWRALSLHDHLKALKSGTAGKQEVLGNEFMAWCDRAGDQTLPLLNKLYEDKGRDRVRRLLFALIVVTTPQRHVMNEGEPFWMTSDWARENRHKLGDFMAAFFENGK